MIIRWHQAALFPYSQALNHSFWVHYTVSKVSARKALKTNLKSQVKPFTNGASEMHWLLCGRKSLSLSPLADCQQHVISGCIWAFGSMHCAASYQCLCSYAISAGKPRSWREPCSRLDLHLRCLQITMTRGLNDTVDPWLFCLRVLLVITPNFHFQLWLAYFENFVCWVMSYQWLILENWSLLRVSTFPICLWIFIRSNTFLVSVMKCLTKSNWMTGGIVLLHSSEEGGSPLWQKGFAFPTQQGLESVNVQVTLTWFSLYPKLKG